MKENKKTSPAQKGTVFRKWVADQLKERGYHVHNQPHMSKRIIVRDKKTGKLKEVWIRQKIDIYGCDILALKGGVLLWIQTTLDPHIKRRMEELCKHFDSKSPGMVQIWIKTYPGPVVNIKQIVFEPVCQIDLGKIIRMKFYNTEGVAYEL